MVTKRVCVIGAGCSGLTAIKQCLDEGLEVVCYEKTDSIGGLWCYHDEDIPSVAKTTIMNTSKEVSAFSDFPPPGHFPNYLENKLMLEYFHRYAKHFKLIQHIQLKHEVIEAIFNEDYEETGRWLVKVTDLSTHEVMESVFDGLMACTGHHFKPMMPEFPGQSKFKGKLLHSGSYKKPVCMENKVAVVVGMGNSAADVAVELSRICSEVYLSTKRGGWVVPRVSWGGLPFDIVLFTRFVLLLLNTLPNNVSSWLMETYANFYFDHKSYGIKPKHRYFSQQPTINDHLANCILSGCVRIRANIERFTEEGVFFEGAQQETKCDLVVFATGYTISFPYMDLSIVSVVNNEVQLYKAIFQPNFKHPHTLAIIGLLEPMGPIFPVAEMQCRWFVQLIKDNLKLPSRADMKKSIETDNEVRRKRFYGSPRQTVHVEYLNYMDELATMIGVKPDLWKYFFTDPALWTHLVFGPSVAYQYRLGGPHSWSGAKAAIMDVEKRALEALKS